MEPNQVFSNFEEVENKFLTKKNILTFLVIGIAVLVIPVTVNMLQKQLTLRTRAAGEPITFVGSNVKCDENNNCTTSSSTVNVELRSPFGPPAIPVSPSPTAGPSSTPGPSPTPGPTIPPTATPVRHVIIAYGALTYTGSAGQKVIQSIFAENGDSWGRTCTVSGNDLICPGSGFVSFGNFLAPNGQKVISYGTSSYKGTTDWKITQTIIAENGDMWNRTCTLSGDTLTCPGSGFVQVARLIPIDGSSQLIIAYGSATYTLSSGQKLAQTIIAENGHTWGRVCVVSGDNLDCSGATAPWQDYGIFTTPDGQRVVSYGAGSYTGGDGIQRVVQSIIAPNSHTWGRTCTVEGNNLNCAAATSPWEDFGIFYAP